MIVFLIIIDRSLLRNDLLKIFSKTMIDILKKILKDDINKWYYLCNYAIKLIKRIKQYPTECAFLSTHILLFVVIANQKSIYRFYSVIIVPMLNSLQSKKLVHYLSYLHPFRVFYYELFEECKEVIVNFGVFDISKISKITGFFKTTQNCVSFKTLFYKKELGTTVGFNVLGLTAKKKIKVISL